MLHPLGAEYLGRSFRPEVAPPAFCTMSLNATEGELTLASVSLIMVIGTCTFTVDILGIVAGK